MVAVQFPSVVLRLSSAAFPWPVARGPWPVALFQRDRGASSWGREDPRVAPTRPGDRRHRTWAR